MKKFGLRFLFWLVLIVALYVTWEQVKGKIFTWYAVNIQTRESATPATEQPDLLCLTWSGDPATTQTVNWRTSSAVSDGWVQYRPRDSGEAPPAEVQASMAVLEEKLVVNDPTNHRFTAVIENLVPATAYTYRAGSREKDRWTEWREFKTGPAHAQPFTFLYLGDAQVGLEYYGELLHRAAGKYPNAAFAVVAGDLVNSGAIRTEWDDFFTASAGVFDRIPVIPCLGNHDYQKQDVPSNYLAVFGLPEQEGTGVPPEHAYTLNYGNTLFVVLDSNLSAEAQAPWLEKQLAESGAKWKIAIYHHPAFSSAPDRDSEGALQVWAPIFDKHHVDLALQGHDHAYLRTYPMRGGEPQETAADGTYYMVTVSGTKYYEQEQHTYAEIAFPKVSTYQVIDIGTNPDVLTYRAYDYDHNERDEVVIHK